MKTCSACGHVNYSIWHSEKGEPICNACGAVMWGHQHSQNAGEVIGVGCYRVLPATQSDDKR